MTSKEVQDPQICRICQGCMFVMYKEWQKGQVWQFSSCCTADSQADVGKNQLHNNQEERVMIRFKQAVIHEAQFIVICSPLL